MTMSLSRGIKLIISSSAYVCMRPGSAYPMIFLTMPFLDCLSWLKWLGLVELSASHYMQKCSHGHNCREKVWRLIYRVLFRITLFGSRHYRHTHELCSKLQKIPQRAYRILHNVSTGCYHN